MADDAGDAHSVEEIGDHPEASRYELRIGGAVAGFVRYRRRPGHVTFVHTEVDPAFEGRGIGGRLARAVLDDARAQSVAVVAECPFIAEYIRRHPDYADLVAPGS